MISNGLSGRLKQNQATPVYLAEVSAGDSLKTWSRWAPGDDFSRPAFIIDYKYRPTELKIDGLSIPRVSYRNLAEDVVLAEEGTYPNDEYMNDLGAWVQEDGALFLILAIDVLVTCRRAG